MRESVESTTRPNELRSVLSKINVSMRMLYLTCLCCSLKINEDLLKSDNSQDDGSPVSNVKNYRGFELANAMKTVSLRYISAEVVKF